MTSHQEFCYARVKEPKASSVSWFDYLMTGQLFASLQAYYIKSVTKAQNTQEAVVLSETGPGNRNRKSGCKACHSVEPIWMCFQVAKELDHKVY